MSSERDERPASLVIGRPSSACGLLTSSLYTPYPPEAPLRGSDGVTRRRSETRNDGPRREAGRSSFYTLHSTRTRRSREP